MLYTLSDRLSIFPTKYELRNEFRQMETLQRLWVDLKLSQSLSPTRDGWAAGPDFLMEVFSHVRSSKPEMVVECGSGGTTVVIAKALESNGHGHVYSLEHTPKFAEKTQRELDKHGLSQWATVLDAPLKEYRMQDEVWPWYVLDNLPQNAIELLVVDGPPGTLRSMARYPAGPFLFQRLAPSGAVFMDDANRSDEKATVQRWLEEFPALRSEVRDCEKGCVVLSLETSNKSLAFRGISSSAHG
jgi:tRNA(1-methyladenosine) methyltransferase and related methyltransferases